MEVILLQDVKALGKKGDKVKVNDGYARNFLLPKKFGIEATQQNLHVLEQEKAAEAKRRQVILDEAKSLAARVEESVVTVEIKAGEGGRTFGSVSTKEICAALKDQFGVELDKKKIVLNEPIRNIGFYTIPVKLHPQVTAKFRVEVKSI